MTDPRLFTNRKFLRLVYLLGLPAPHVLGHLEFLWRAAHTAGDPVLGDETDVEVAAQWGGVRGALTTALVEVGFLSRVGQGRFAVCDFIDVATIPLDLHTAQAPTFDLVQ